MNRKKTALVTGGSRGIGRAIAEELAGCGFDIGLVYNSSREKAEIAAAACREKGARVEIIQGDIGSRESRISIIEEFKSRFQRLDVLVNNAGIAPSKRRDILEATEESFDRVVAVNLKGTYFLTQAACRWMIEQKQADNSLKPVIITVSSVSAYASSVNRGEYCISKAALSMVTKLFAHRLAEFGIGVFEIRPGIIETDMTHGVKEKYDELMKNDFLPINRWGRPQDVARAVSAVALGHFPYSTGEVINVDGGFHLRRL